MTAEWQSISQAHAGRVVALDSQMQKGAGPLCRKVLNEDAGGENWPGQDHCTRRCACRIEGTRWQEARRTPPGSWPGGRDVAGTSRDVMHKAIAPVSQSKVCARAEDYVRALCGAVRPWSQSRPSADFCSEVVVVGGISAIGEECTTPAWCTGVARRSYLSDAFGPAKVKNLYSRKVPKAGTANERACASPSAMASRFI